MDKRMTWEEIKTAYPNKWVGLSQVEWKDEANVKSAIVSYAGDSSKEPFLKQVAGEDMYTTYTGTDEMCPLGCLTVMP
ncbi:MAG: hypothetical protein IJT01_10900 [Selenomonadaceae bacterium]|nr:hypothetical protein [Selenomonadaceae bacterium]